MSSDLPTAVEVCQEYFGSTDDWECREIFRAREDKSLSEFSDKTCDTSLFPYLTQGPLETPIPTLAEIASARDRKSEGSFSSQCVWRVGPYMVKVGVDVTAFQEAENLIYLERNSTVRTAKLYAAFISEDVDLFPHIRQRNRDWKKLYFIIMEYIDGQDLDDVEDELKKNNLVWRKVTQLLAEQLRRLRSVSPEDPNHFGRINGRAYQHIPPFYYAPDPEFRDYGPFNYEELVKRLIHSGKLDNGLSGHPHDYNPVNRLLYSNVEAVLLDNAGPSDRIPVLSHMDPQFHNIMVKLVRDQEGKAVDVEEVILIDWEFMCWMPSWYEAADMCQISLCENDYYISFGTVALERMGHVNIAMVLFFSTCVIKGAFFFVHV